MAAGRSSGLTTRRGVPLSRTPVDPKLDRNLELAFDPALRVPAWLDAKIDESTDRSRIPFVEQKYELEAHIRLMRVDRVLQTLGWHMGKLDPSNLDSLCNMNIKVSVRPSESRYKKWLDYFGFDATTHMPLLIVETKRPDVNLGCHFPDSHPENHPFSLMIYRHLNKSLVNTNSVEFDENEHRLSGPITEAIDQLQEYVRQVTTANQPPKRAMLTNGEWFIVFVNPTRTFIDDSLSEDDAKSIVVFETPSVVSKHADIFKRQLGYQSPVEVLNPIPAAAISSHIGGSSVTWVAKGLRMLRVEDEKWSTRVPRIEVSPMLILGSEGAAWIRVVGSTPNRMVPFAKDDQIPDHLAQVRQDTMALWKEVEQFLQTQLPKPMPLDQLVNPDIELHVCDPVFSVYQQPGTLAPKRFYLLTGNRSHFLDTDETYDGCSGHDFTKAYASNKNVSPVSIVSPSVTPRAFFPNRSRHHCCHSDIHVGRQQMIPSSPSYN